MKIHHAHAILAKVGEVHYLKVPSSHKTPWGWSIHWAPMAAYESLVIAEASLTTYRKAKP